MKRKIGLMVLFISILYGVFVVGASDSLADTRYEWGGMAETLPQAGSETATEIDMARDGRLEFYFLNDTSGSMELVVTNSAGESVFSQMVVAQPDTVTVSTGTLLKGKYRISVVAKEDSTFCDIDIDVIYLPDIDNPEVSINVPSITIQKGKTKQLSTISSPSNASYSVQWYSEDPKIATVDSKGKVRGKKKGTATICAKITPASGAGHPVIECTVKVKNPNPSFAAVLKKMKSLAKKTHLSVVQKKKKASIRGVAAYNRNITVEDIIEDEYDFMGYMGPVIKLSKHGKKTTLSLDFTFCLAKLSLENYPNMNCDEILFKSGKSKVSFSFHAKKTKDKVSVTNKAEIKIFSDTKINMEKLNQWIAILKKHKVILRIYTNDGDQDIINIAMTQEARKLLLNVLQNYKKLLTLY